MNEKQTDASSQTALDTLQNEVWGSMQKYSDKLGWGLTGIQPECWCLLDNAVDELVTKRTALRKIKLYCCTNKDPEPEALVHIIRMCIDAGVKEQYTELEKMLKKE